MNPIIWNEGTQLNQQYFQQWDRYWQQQLAITNQFVAAFHWGFTKLDTSLKNNRFILHNFQLLLADGRFCEFEQQQQSYRLQLDLEMKNATIFLHIFHPHQVSSINGYPEPRQSAAYRAHYALCRDQHDPNRKAQIQIVEPIYSIANSKNENALFNIPIVKISTSNDLQLRNCSEFIASTLFISLATNLTDKTNALIVLINHNYPLKQNPSLDSNFSHLHMLHIYKQRLSILVTNSHTHPYQLYLILGEIKMLLQPLDMKIINYDHHNIGLCFTVLIKEIETILENKQQPKKDTKAKYDFLDNNIICVNDLKPEDNKKLHLTCSAARHGARQLTEITQQVKIAPRTLIHNTICHSLPSAKFELVHTKNTASHSYYNLIFDLPAHAELICNNDNSICFYLPPYIKLCDIEIFGGENDSDH